MPHERDDNATDPAKPEMLSYAGPRQPGEDSPTTGRRLLDIGWLDVLIVVTIGVALVGLVLPALVPWPRSGYSHTVACASNLRQVFYAMQHYCTEYGGVYPMHIADVTKYTGGSGGCFVCPQSGLQRSPGPTTAQVEADLRNPAIACCSYVLVVPGMKQRSMKPNTIVLHEQLPSAHKNGVANFAYADGSVRSLTTAEAKWAIAELAAGYNPPRAIKSGPATTSTQRN